MFKRIFRVILAVSLLAGSLSLTGCDTLFSNDSSSGDPALSGYWESTYDGFEIDGSNFLQYDDAAKAVSFAGTIQGNPNLDKKAGSFTIKITDTGSWGKTVGAYYIIMWKNLTDDGVSQSSANNGDFTDVKNNGMSTAALAEKEYTIENGYFGYFGDYLKQ